jgi:hypothetical protein
MTILVGDTVKLKATFCNWNGEYSNIADIKCTIYNDKKNVITTITDIINADTGKYECLYTVPDGYNGIIFEFSGVLNNKPIINRQYLSVKWSQGI